MQQKPFPIVMWRELLTKTCKQIDIYNVGLEVISPFGFELLEDKRFLYKNLRRLYCYIGIPTEKNKYTLADEIEDSFAKLFLQELSQSEKALFQSIIMLRTSKSIRNFCQPGYICQPQDKLLFIKSREINKGLLDDYCDYIVTVIGGFAEKNHPQLRDFDTDKIARNHIFQLFFMLEKLLESNIPIESNIPKLSKVEETLLSQINLDNSLQIILDNRTNVESSPFEKEILNQLILPRVELMNCFLRELSDENEKITELFCKSYHGNDILSVKISNNKLLDLTKKISKTYLEFQ
ncbi:MAG: hypothetical protein HYZ50_15545 [Deltaproteobacteria bacterium]|nr:hypothetical protein [Deltaproteobacteria bacterium]